MIAFTMVGVGGNQPGEGSKTAKGFHPQNLSNNSAIHLCKIVWKSVCVCVCMHIRENNTTVSIDP